MTSRDRVIRTLEFRTPDRVPRELWYLPGVEQSRRVELERLLDRYPMDFHVPVVAYGIGDRELGVPNTIGTYFDEWGCGWRVAEEGVVGEVKHHPLADWSALAHYRAPWETLATADCSRDMNAAAGRDRFIRASTRVRLFERMQFLRGPENLYLDLAYQPAEFFQLLDLVHDFFRSEIERWSQTEVQGISFIDDWGAQHNMLIDPESWRAIFKPRYAEYCSIIKKTGKFVFFHTDGFVEPILEDLIEIGVDALNAQLFCMDIERIAEQCKGRITFWGEICRQHVLPFGSVDDVRQAVLRVRGALESSDGGVIAQCEWGLHDPYENIETVYKTWEEPLG